MIFWRIWLIKFYKSIDFRNTYNDLYVFYLVDIYAIFVSQLKINYMYVSGISCKIHTSHTYIMYKLM